MSDLLAAIENSGNAELRRVAAEFKARHEAMDSKGGSMLTRNEKQQLEAALKPLTEPVEEEEQPVAMDDDPGHDPEYRGERLDTIAREMYYNDMRRNERNCASYERHYRDRFQKMNEQGL
jgi:hypothetical protein